ncbi:MAG: GNAT family N-acetyltransferase [Clostridiales bacterium]|nr:GNAT family N-acetyltransferase [Clostridiales bacterium]
MKYAILSDVHGNYPAMAAALDDAGRRGADGYLLVGDYYADLPWPNEVAEAMRALPGLIAVRGNKEGYLIALSGQDQATWTDEQSAALYWNYRELTDDNREYLMALPEEASFRVQGVDVRAFHRSSRLFSGTCLSQLRSSAYATRMAAAPFGHGEYLQFVARLTEGDRALRDRLDALPPAVYVFGHSHLQWHARVGDSLLINPGACGLPLDSDQRAPYAMLELAGGRATVTEHRVAYDTRGAADALRASALYRASPIWCEVLIEELTGATEVVSGFLRLADRVARREGSERRPFEDRIWRMAFDAWRAGEGRGEVTIRVMSEGDYDGAHRLWVGAQGIGMRSKDDSREGIARFLMRNPATCFVAEEDGELVGAVLCGHDGRRAYVYHAAVRAEHRRRGVAGRLVAAVTEALGREGIAKAALVVFKQNQPGNAFWRSQGWEMRDDLNYYNLSLDPDNR